MRIDLLAEMQGVREYEEGYAVYLEEIDDRICVFAHNEGGHNGTSVDLLDLIVWLRKNRPELLDVG